MNEASRIKLENLRSALSGIEAQRAILGEAIVGPAVESLREKIAALESQIAQEAQPEIVRRIVTILFTDIVGSTTLAENMDPEEWREIVAAIHAMAGSKIQENRGVVLQFLGDGLLALFGAQSASEQDPENALHAALDIQVGLVELPLPLLVEMRIGIHTGLVVLGELGSEGKKELTATGDAMNLAARLQTAAPPGRILISHDTFRYVQGGFELSPQSPLWVKGKPDPLRSYLVERARPRIFRTIQVGVPGVETGLVGREAERSQLKKALRKAIEEGSRVWVQVIGEPGLGKSRLLWDVLDFIANQPIEVGALRGRAFQGDEHRPYSLIRSMWFDQFQIAEDIPLEQAEALWEASFLELGGPGHAEAAHTLGLLLGLPFYNSPHISRALRQDPEQLKGRAIVVSRELLDAIQEHRPLMVLLEDLQWADSASWEYLVEVVLSDGFLKNGLFIAGTARSEWDPPKELLEHPVYQYIDLKPLPESDFHQLVSNMLGSVEGVTPDIIKLIVERSEGVPYFAEEMVNWFIDQGIIDINQSPWQFQAGRLEGNPLPVTLQHLLLTRLSALNTSERTTLQRGSVYGRNFWEGGLKALDVSEPGKILVRLGPRGLVRKQAESSLAGEQEWSFNQTLMRDVTYESVLKRERKRLHEAAGAWLERQARQAGRLQEFADLLGAHAEAAGDISNAADWYIQAGEYAYRRGALREARRFLDRALEYLSSDDHERRWSAMLVHDEILAILGDYEARMEDDRQLLALAQDLGDINKEGIAYYRQGFAFTGTGDHSKAITSLDTALHIARQAGNDELEALCIGLKTVCLTLQGDLQSAAVAAQEGLHISLYVQDENALRKLLTNISIYFMAAGDLARAIQVLKQQVEMLNQAGDLSGEANALANLGYAYIRLGLYKEGCETLESSIRLGDAIGSKRTNDYCRLNLGLSQLRCLNLQAAHQVLEGAISRLKTIGDLFGMGAGLTYLGIVHEKAGNCAGAHEAFNQAQKILGERGYQGYQADALAGLARCALANRDSQLALELTNTVWSYLQEQGSEAMEFPILAYLTCAQIYSALGDADKSAAAAKAGYQQVMQRAEKISNLSWRHTFLSRVPENQAILELAK